MEKKHSAFVLYNSWLEPVRKLTNINAGKLIKAILEFVNGIEPEVDQSIEGLYLAITEQIVFEWSKINPKTGKYHWNYKGGITSENHIIRNSIQMENWRTKVFKRDGYICQICGQLGGKLNAHHIEPFAKFPELRFEVSNGMTLCNKCHINEHRRLNSERGNNWI